MANRDLPNVYTTLNDMSAIVEGDESLITGITLRANRGPIGVASLVQDSSDFLTKYTFSGKPGVKQDSTYFDIIELLKASRNVYVSRAALNPLFGGLIVKKEVEVGKVLKIAQATESVDEIKRSYTEITVDANTGAKIEKESFVRFSFDKLLSTDREQVRVIDKYAGDADTIILKTYTLFDGLAEDSDVKEYYEAIEGGKVYQCIRPVPLTNIVVKETFEVEDVEKKQISVIGDVKVHAGDRICIDKNFYTIKKIEGDEGNRLISLKEDITALSSAEDKTIKLDSIADPEAYAEFLGKEDLFLITGIDQGAYNSSLGIAITSSNEAELEEPDCFKVEVYNLETSKALEEYLVSMSLTKKATDGTNMHIKDIINPMSDYIQVYTASDEKIDEEAIAPSTGVNPVALGGGYDGDEDTDHTADLEALQVFADKSVPVSVLVNGHNEYAEYQAAMIAICESRLDCFAFLRTPKYYETQKLISQRVKNLTNYKKNTLASKAVSATTASRSTNFKPHFKTAGGTKESTGADSYLAAMYGPHVTVTDLYNSRKVVIGADSVACKQWLNVIGHEGFPYAAAGPRLGTMTSGTVDWKIGDESAEAMNFNDASMNMIVYEARQKYYYFNTQNTLQMANSAFRNVGAVLNVLNIKESLARRLKDYVQLPISDDLQEAVIRTICDYMDGCKSGNRVSDYALNNETTKNDISNNELHFMLTLAPAYYAQKIYLVVNVVNAAFDFQILQSL